MIFIGPKLKPITGQSKCFHTTFQVYDGNAKCITYPSRGEKYVIFSSIYFIYKVVFELFKQRSNIYLTNSRSKGGFFRDFVIFSISRIYNVKLVVHLHGADFASFCENSGKVQSYLIHFMYNRIHGAIVLLPKMKDQFKKFHKLKILVLENFHDIDVPLIRIDTKIHKFKNTERIKCVFISNIIDSKGIWEAIAGVRALVRLGYNVSLDIYGELLCTGLEREGLEEKLRQNCDDDHIRYHGPIYGEAKIEVLLENDVFILPTYYPTEAMPLVLIEAAACGLVLVTTDHNYITDFITTKNGAIIKTKDVEEIICAIIEIYNNRHHFADVMLFNSQEFCQRYQIKNYERNFNFLIKEFSTHAE